MPLAETPITTSFFVGRSRLTARSAFLVVVLDALTGAERRAAAAGHHGLHQRLIGAERRRHLGRLEHAEPPARAGADEHDAAAATQALRDHVGAERDAVLLPLHRRDDATVFVHHQFDDVGGGELVDGERGGVDGFGGQELPLRTNRHCDLAHATPVTRRGRRRL